MQVFHEWKNERKNNIKNFSWRNIDNIYRSDNSYKDIYLPLSVDTSKGKRSSDTNKNRDTTLQTEQYNIYSSSSFILGIPTETEAFPDFFWSFTTKGLFIDSKNLPFDKHCHVWISSTQTLNLWLRSLSVQCSQPKILNETNKKTPRDHRTTQCQAVVKVSKSLFK